MTPYELGQLAAQQNNVPGHLKQAYAEGFAGVFEKSALPRGLGGIPQGADPAQMTAALQLLGQARALGTPTEKELKRKGTNTKGYERSLRRMRRKKRLSDARANVALDSGLGAALGAALGSLIPSDDESHARGINALLGGSMGALLGHARARHTNKNILATMKVLKDRGVLTPALLQKAYPVLMTPRTSPA